MRSNCNKIPGNCLVAENKLRLTLSLFYSYRELTHYTNKPECGDIIFNANVCYATPSGFDPVVGIILL